MSIQQVGRYELRGKLGQGGMATVYQGYDPRFKRDVAIKILPSEFLSAPNLRERFEREAQIIAMLEHPAIVPVYDYGEEDDRPYLVMRLMPGGSLADRLARGPLPLPDIANLLERLAPALDHAHSLHIVHRDLKPGNILFDAFGHPYISDFGIAKLYQTTATTSKTGLMGTPDYMAPEQVMGDKQIDGRADLYALGVIVYQMLTGKVPYDGDTPMSVAFKHVTEPPPRLSSVRPDLAPAFDTFMTKALAKDPAGRYQNAAELLAAVQRAIGTQPTAPKLGPAATMLEVGPGPTMTPPPPPSQPVSFNQPAPSVRPPTAPPVQPTPATPLPVQPAAPRRSSSTRWLLIGVLVVGVLGLGVVVLGGAAVAAYSYFTSRTPTEAVAPTDEDTPTDEPSATDDGSGNVVGELTVTGQRTYVDNYGYFHVVGLVSNDTGSAATSVGIVVRVTDSNGDSVLPPDDVGDSDSITINPLLYTIDQGEVAPFDFYFDAGGSDGSDWQAEVELGGFEAIEAAPADVAVTNDRIFTGSDGTIWLTGELVNQGDTPVQVNTLAAALLASDGTAVGADASYNATRYLAPSGDANGQDRTPFSISIDGSADDYDTFSYYFDADQTEAPSAADNVSVEIINAFVDDYDTLHIFTNVTNNGDQVLTISLVAGLYDVDGVALDAAFTSIPINVAPGATIPLSFDNFNAIYGNPDELDAVDTYSVQVDYYWTYEFTTSVAALATSNESVSSADGLATFSGEINNDSGSDLGSVNVIMALYDGDGNLYSSSWTSVYPDGDTFAAGDTLPFGISLPIRSGDDISDYTFVSYVEGYYP